MNNRPATLALLGVALAIAACHDRVDRDRGPVMSEARQVRDFDSIEMTGSARLEITVGGAAALTIEGPERSVHRVDSKVRGDTLHIRVNNRRDWAWGTGNSRLTLRVNVPHLASLEVSGGNDVRLMGYAGGDSKIKVEGATHLSADGRLDELTVFMAGAGHADFSKLVADDARVTVAGVGSVFVHPRNSLDATMNGVGAIFYTGSPREVNTHMNGLGTIGRGDPKDDEKDDDEQAARNEQGVAPGTVEKPPVDPDKLKPEYDPKAEKIEKILEKSRPTETI